MLNVEGYERVQNMDGVGIQKWAREEQYGSGYYWGAKVLIRKLPAHLDLQKTLNYYATSINRIFIYFFMFK